MHGVLILLTFLMEPILIPKFSLLYFSNGVLIIAEEAVTAIKSPLNCKSGIVVEAMRMMLIFEN